MLPWRLPGRLAHLDFGVCVLGPIRASEDTTVYGLPRAWHHMRPVLCFCVSGWAPWGAFRMLLGGAAANRWGLLSAA